MRAAVLCLVASSGVGCTFNPSGPARASRDAAPLDAAPPIYAVPADAAIACQAGEVECHGRQLRTCNETGDGFASVVDCAFACGELECKAGSNLGEAFATCAGDAPALTPPAGAVVSLDSTEGGDLLITCDPECGGGATSVPVSGVVVQGGGQRSIAYVCLAELDLPADARIELRGRVVPSVALVVHRVATIAGTIDVGGRAAEVDQSGAGGPGAGDGAQPQVMTNGDGLDGAGIRPGRGGAASASQSDTAAGGGGGGGFAGLGGSGGLGVNTAGEELGAGGVGGSPVGGNIRLIPLVAGSGGGGGADSQCAGACGFPGGGGGGALQISARQRITVSGEIRSNGGAGFGSSANLFKMGGGGGGGSGGGVLLEAPIVEITGSISVAGGAGGRAGAGLGGTGGAGATPDGLPGTAADPDNMGPDGPGAGGAGGGGGGGRVRLNALTAPSCTGVSSPLTACTSGSLPGESND